MNGEQRILVAGGLILVIGTVSSYQKKKPLDKPIIGGLTLILLLAGLAALGSGPAELAGQFALLALVAVILAEGVPILKSVNT